TEKLDKYEEIFDEEDENAEPDRIYTEVKEGDRVHFGGIITATDKIMTRSNSYMGFVTVEDLYGSIECTLFPKTFTEAREFLNNDELIEVWGRIHIKGNTVSVNADRVAPLKATATVNSEPEEKEYLGLIFESLSEDEQLKLFDVLQSYVGEIPVILAIGGKKYKINCSVRKCEGLISELKLFLDEKSIVFFKKKS
ncbi:MAG: OB-fold nucleic acid binding domain-containing protein, partial [Clostridia bacterium]|nr:OB-fold nucleic acid binding domain-containing protein [Clostridia bacterium]